jgi:iron complex transport system substrate-binding protein
MSYRYIAIFLCFILLGCSAEAEALTCDEGFHAITHASGETCVPDDPQRIVSLDMTITELLLIGDYEPVAVSQTAVDAYLDMHPEFEGELEELMETANDTGLIPNPEVILRSDPDLIIGPRDQFGGSLYPILNRIAPTILYEAEPGDWQGRLTFAGEVLGMTDTVDELLADYDTRIEELQAAVDEEETEVSLVRTFPGQIGLVLTGTAGAGVLADAGLARPDSQAVDYAYVADELNGRPEQIISEEELRLANGDVIFVFGDTSDLQDNPLWEALPAVENGNTHEVGYYWWGEGLASAHDMLDDLFEHVAGVESPSPNPFAEGEFAPPGE